MEEVSWENIYAPVHKTTPDPKLRWFQLRLLYRIIPTNKYLLMCKIKNSALCTHCAVEENILHLLWECQVATNFWKNVCNWIYQSMVPSVNTEVTNTIKLVILGMDGSFIPDLFNSLTCKILHINQQTARNCSQCSRFQVHC